MSVSMSAISSMYVNNQTAQIWNACDLHNWWLMLIWNKFKELNELWENMWASFQRCRESESEAKQGTDILKNKAISGGEWRKQSQQLLVINWRDLQKYKIIKNKSYERMTHSGPSIFPSCPKCSEHWVDDGVYMCSE